MSSEMNRSFFINSLRDALTNLYNPYELKHNPLQSLLEEHNPAVDIELKQVLISAVHSLMPDEHTPYDTKEWKFYELLYYCFIDRLGQKETAKNLMISLRTLQRLLPEAITVLGEKLVSDYHLVGVDDDGTPAQSRSGEPTLPQEDAWDQETALLMANSPAKFIDIHKMLKEIIQILQPLSGPGDSKVKVIFPEETWLVMGQVTILRQAVLTAVSYFDPHEPGLEINISAGRTAGQGFIQILGQGREPDPDNRSLSRQAEIPEALTNLMCLLQGSSEIHCDYPNQRAILLTFPAQQQYKIMMIDDNADAIRLVEKYLSSGIYSVIGVKDPEQVLPALENEQPALILLDVMLPNIDGWMLLGQIRRRPILSGIPVIISTILPQEELSLTLGADGFLRKPYTQQELLQVLDMHLLKNPM
jgi:CheY-like chemotaxis protein